MNKFITMLTASIAFTLPAFAAGKYEASNNGHNEQDKSAYDQHGAQETVVHKHAAKKGAVGHPAQPSPDQRTIHVSLSDDKLINFAENIGEIKSGTMINFVVTNKGKIPHGFFIGNEAERKAHANMMLRMQQLEMPGMVHSIDNRAMLAPGETRQIAWHFEGKDQVVFSCNFPGHFEAGMFREIPLKP